MGAYEIHRSVFESWFCTRHSCVALGNLLSISEPQLPRLENRSSEHYHGRWFGGIVTILIVFTVKFWGTLVLSYFTDRNQNTVFAVFVCVFMAVPCLHNIQIFPSKLCYVLHELHVLRKSEELGKQVWQLFFWMVLYAHATPCPYCKRGLKYHTINLGCCDVLVKISRYLKYLLSRFLGSWIK